MLSRKNTFIFIVSLVILVSCNFFKEKGIQFVIENDSDHTIENVKISTSEKLNIEEFKKIQAHKRISGFLSMKNNTQDGSYTIEFVRYNGKKESRKYGYYTNGIASDNQIIFKIQNDTLTSVIKKSLY